jgi:hypothetical protein
VAASAKSKAGARLVGGADVVIAKIRGFSIGDRTKERNWRNLAMASIENVTVFERDGVRRGLRWLNQTERRNVFPRNPAGPLLS